MRIGIAYVSDEAETSRLLCDKYDLPVFLSITSLHSANGPKALKKFSKQSRVNEPFTLVDLRRYSAHEYLYSPSISFSWTIRVDGSM